MSRRFFLAYVAFVAALIALDDLIGITLWYGRLPLWGKYLSGAGTLVASVVVSIVWIAAWNRYALWKMKRYANRQIAKGQVAQARI